MFIADELDKFLVCEICFDKLNESSRLPTTLFPCGHTFCVACVRALTSKKCAACATDFEFTATNWSLVHLVPKAKLADNYESVRELVTRSLDLLQSFSTLNEEKNHTCLNALDTIRSEINAKVNEFIDKIKQSQASLLEKLSECESKWKRDYDEYAEFRGKCDSTFTDADAQLKLEEVKTNAANLEKVKAKAEKSLNELNAFKLKFGCGSGDEEILLFKKSNLFNMSASEVFSEANLFGEIIFNRNSKASII